MEPQAPQPKGVLGEGTYTAKHIIVATGARPRALPGIEPDGKLIWTYFEAMVPKEMPKSLLVMGSGAIGIEFASFYRTMGVDVTVVELMPQVMPVEDAEISKPSPEAVREAGHEDPARSQGDEGREGREFDHRPCREEGRQDGEDHRRSDDFGRRRARQHRESRARSRSA
jgi:pyruvate/2-oxoglutarate dehydrogenase complex dihydrolipoamide dehydrogenase (E3) component